MITSIVETNLMTDVKFPKRLRDILDGIMEISKDGMDTNEDTSKAIYQAMLLAHGGDLAAGVDLVNSLPLKEATANLVWQLSTLALSRQFDIADRLIDEYRSKKIKALKNGKHHD